MQLYSQAAGQQYAQNAYPGFTPEQLKFYGQNMNTSMELLSYYQQQQYAQQYIQEMQKQQQLQKHAQYPPTSVSSGNRKSQTSSQADMLQVIFILLYLLQTLKLNLDLQKKCCCFQKSSSFFLTTFMNKYHRLLFLSQSINIPPL